MQMNKREAESNKIIIIDFFGAQMDSFERVHTPRPHRIQPRLDDHRISLGFVLRLLTK